MKELIKEVDIENIPHKEVLAFNKADQLIVGYLSYNDRTDRTLCENEEQVLDDITHYIEVEDLIKLKNEQFS